MSESKHSMRLTLLFAAVTCIAALIFGGALLASNSLADEAYAAQLQTTDLQSGSTDDELQTQSVKKYKIWVGNIRVTSANAKNVLGNGTVSYDAKTNTLTLKNAKINKASSAKDKTMRRYYGIQVAVNNLKIKLVGKNTISVPRRSNAATSYGIGTTQEGMGITILGNGSLNVSSNKADGFSHGIIAGKLTIQGKAKVTARGATANQNTSYGVRCSKNEIVLKGSSQLVAYGKTNALSCTPTFGSGYTPQVKAGASSKKISVNKKKPATSVYTKYKYVKITKAKASSKAPAKETITSLKAKSGGFSAAWKQLSKNCSGYQIQYSTNKAFNKTKATIYTNTIYTKNCDGCTVTKLKKGTTYYVHVRALNKVGSKTYYGAWSAVKSVKTRS